MIGLRDPRPARAATVWQSYALATAIKADPSYLTFVRDRDALASIVFEVHAPFWGNPSLQRALESPVAEIGYYLACDREANPDARPAVETHELVTRAQSRFGQLLQGFVASGAGVAIEDGLRGVYVCGWGSIEVRSFAPMRSLARIFVS
jgi:hypothetical protein